MTVTVDYLIVGAGLFGATCARLLTDAGQRVHVIERRNYLGGNCADVIEDGIRRCLHGGHIFHTNSARVWEFANRFSDWTPYTHRIAVFSAGMLYSFPINLLTFAQVLGCTTPTEARRAWDTPQKRAVLVNLFYRGYSEKQWGVPLEDVPGGAIERIPVRFTYDDRCYSDRYQGLPVDGYTEMARRMLGNIPVDLSTPFDLDYWRGKARRIIYTGALDELYNRQLGKLPWRSLFFHDIRYDGDYQGCATINYPDPGVAWTRVLEHKHYGWQKSDTTIVTFEYPAAEGEPYYPVRTPESEALWREYAQLAAVDGVIAAGRLGGYKYIDMDQTIAAAMRLVEKEGKS